jgi:hypothetical protein
VGDSVAVRLTRRIPTQVIVDLVQQNVREVGYHSALLLDRMMRGTKVENQKLLFGARPRGDAPILRCPRDSR